MTQKNILILVGVVIVAGIIIYFGINSMGGLKGVAYQPGQTYSNNEGTVTTGGNSMPKTWPSDAPQNYAGATIVFSGDSNPQTGTAGAVVSYTVKGVSAKTIADYYQSQLTSKGWTISGNANLGSQTVVGGKKDTRTFAASIVDNGGGMVTVTAGLQLQ
jgi:hypothetical protein